VFLTFGVILPGTVAMVVFIGRRKKNTKNIMNNLLEQDFGVFPFLEKTSLNGS
jgi:hypothetical protein